LDIGLPVLNGYEACRLIREKLHQHPPIMIAITGWGQDSDRQKSQEAGFNGHLVKPVDFAKLLILLPELIAKRPLPTECGSHSLKQPRQDKGEFIDLEHALNSQGPDSA
jgi:CheY-like chemotaxis protein